MINLLSFGINRWEVYIGRSPDHSVQTLTSVLQEHDIQYDLKKAPPLYMYDPTKEQTIVKNENMNISLIYVTADPLTRFFSSILGTKGHLSSVTLLSVQFNKHAKSEVSNILHSFVKSSPEKPWELKGHTRFRYAVLLRLINKWKWKRYSTVM